MNTTPSSSPRVDKVNRIHSPLLSVFCFLLLFYPLSTPNFYFIYLFRLLWLRKRLKMRGWRWEGLSGRGERGSRGQCASVLPRGRTGNVAAGWRARVRVARRSGVAWRGAAELGSGSMSSCQPSQSCTKEPSSLAGTCFFCFFCFNVCWRSCRVRRPSASLPHFPRGV